MLRLQRANGIFWTFYLLLGLLGADLLQVEETLTCRVDRDACETYSYLVTSNCTVCIFENIELANDTEIIQFEVKDGESPINELSAVVFNGESSEFIAHKLLTVFLNLKTLWFEGSDFPSILSSDFFGKNDILQSVILSYCQLQSIGANAFTNIKEITMLSIFRARSPIEEIHADAFKDLTKLKTLMLHFNDLTKINPRWFQNTHSLDILDLQGNQIMSIESGTFDHLPELRELYLQDNPIKKLPPTIFAKNLKLKKLLITLVECPTRNITLTEDCDKKITFKDIASLDLCKPANCKIPDVANGRIQNLITYEFEVVGKIYLESAALRVVCNYGFMLKSEMTGCKIN